MSITVDENRNVVPTYESSNYINSFSDVIGNAVTGNTDFDRQLYLNKYNNAFNANEAAKAWERSEQSALNAFERQKELAQNEYSYKIEDLKKNGLNPYLALTGGASVPSTPSGSSSSARGSGGWSGNSSHKALQFAESIARLAISAYTLSQNSGAPSDYTDYFTDGDGNVKGSRTRIFSRS